MSRGSTTCAGLASDSVFKTALTNLFTTALLLLLLLQSASTAEVSRSSINASCITTCKQQQRGNRRHQTPPPVRCCLWWVGWSTRHGIKSAQPHDESLTVLNIRFCTNEHSSLMVDCRLAKEFVETRRLSDAPRTCPGFCGQLCANMAPSTKPEAHNRRRIEPG